MCCWNKSFSKRKSWSKVCLFRFDYASYVFKLSDAIMDWFYLLYNIMLPRKNHLRHLWGLDRSAILISKIRYWFQFWTEQWLKGYPIRMQWIWFSINLDFEEKNNSTHPDYQTKDLAPGSDDYHEGWTSTTSMLAQADGRHLNQDLPSTLNLKTPREKIGNVLC